MKRETEMFGSLDEVLVAQQQEATQHLDQLTYLIKLPRWRAFWTIAIGLALGIIFQIITLFSLTFLLVVGMLVYLISNTDTRQQAVMRALEIQLRTSEPSVGKRVKASTSMGARRFRENQEAATKYHAALMGE